MASNKVGSVMLLACLAVSGCADVWIKPGATDAELADNRYFCNNGAMKDLPPDVVTYKVHDAYVTPVDTQCKKRGDKIDCTTTGGQLVPEAWDSYDKNATPRRDYVRQCMTSLGWRLK